MAIAGGRAAAFVMLAVVAGPLSVNGEAQAPTQSAAVVSPTCFGVNGSTVCCIFSCGTVAPTPQGHYTQRKPLSDILVKLGVPVHCLVGLCRSCGSSLLTPSRRQTPLGDVSAAYY